MSGSGNLIELVKELETYKSSGKSDVPDALYYTWKKYYKVDDKTLKSEMDGKQLQLKRIEYSPDKDMPTLPLKRTLTNLNELFIMMKKIKVKDIQHTFTKGEIKIDDSRIADINRVDTLYKLDAYLEDNFSKASEYPDYETERLMPILDKAMAKIWRGNEALEALKELVSIAHSQFKTAEGKMAYDNHLLLLEIAPKVKEDIITATDNDKNSTTFAQRYISIIKKTFPKEREAEAIYSDYAKISTEAYLKIVGEEAIRCNHCQRHTFARDSRKKNAKCMYCNTSLFIPCPKCKEDSVESEICQCGFNLPRIKEFGRYYDFACKALNEKKLDIASENLEIAKEINPTESRLKQLQDDYSELWDIKQKYEQSIEKTENRYFERLRLIREIRTIEPQWFEDDEIFVKNEISRINEMVSAAEKLSISERTIAYISIIKICADFEKARLFFIDNPPNDVKSISLSVNPRRKKIAIDCNYDSSDCTLYTIVRKYNSSSINVDDGDIVSENLKIPVFTDDCADSGKVIYYTVFATRFGGISKGKSDSCMLLSEVSDVVVFGADKKMSISCECPQNCKAVKLFKNTTELTSDGSNGECIDIECNDNGSLIYEDINVENFTKYYYLIKAVYSINQKEHLSNGTIVSEYPVPKPDIPCIVAKRMTTIGVFEISWSSDFSKRSFIIWLMPNTENTYSHGDVIDDLPISGEQLFKTFTGEKKTEISLPAGGEHRIVSLIKYRNEYIVGNSILLNTCEPIEIVSTIPLCRNNELIFGISKPMALPKALHYEIVHFNSKDVDNPNSRSLGVVINQDVFGEVPHEIRIKRPPFLSQHQYYLEIWADYNVNGEIRSCERKLYPITIPAEWYISYEVSLTKIFKSFVSGTITIFAKKIYGQGDIPPKLRLCASARKHFGATSNGTVEILKIKDYKSNKLLRLSIPKENLSELPLSSVEIGLKLFMDDSETDKISRIVYANSYTGRVCT